jgi:peptidoglycan/xylan/chitin deacetylase (PgdA/CDA1 family)
MSLRPNPAAGPDDRLVLCYHAVSDSAQTTLTVPDALLRRQLVTLLDRGYEAVTFQQAVGGSARTRKVAVTFDDAEPSVLRLALPVLAELGLPGTLFVPVDRIGGAGLSWDDVSALAQAGWEIGSHTLSHPRLPELGEAELERELRGSREAIEDALGLPCHSIAYPYGEVNARVRAAAARAGFTAGCTVGGALRIDDPLVFPRVGIDGRDTLLTFRAKTSRAGRASRASALGRPLAFVGRAARSAAAAQFALQK